MGYSPFQPDGSGFFRPDLNFEMYWPDDASKSERFYQILSQTDYIVMSSNRQFGTIPRAPEKYPLSTHFYRELLNCPDEMDTVVCYYEAESEHLNPEFGFDLIKTFTSYPRLGSWEFNDQYAEEAFSVYDHPKVLIFRKNEHFDPERLLKILNEVDISKALPLTPKQMDEYKPQSQSGNSDLMLKDEEIAVQQGGGTWSALFDRESLLNKYRWLGVVALYLFFLILGWVAFPIVMLAFPGLNDKGYAFARIVGLLLFALFAFNLGSLKIEVTRALLLYVLLAITMISVAVAGFNRKKLQDLIKNRWKLISIEEIVFLIAFLFFLWIRYNNPDLWHPWRGGEKPMDFSYLNAVIKSSTFPAYDPWFAGGFINYYYYGQVLVALPIKLLGIVPAVAYNICLALWYAMLVVAAFSIGWNLTWFVLARKASDSEVSNGMNLPLWGGIASSLLLPLLGNLGTIKVLSDGLAILGSNGADITQTNFFQYVGWAIQGIASMRSGAQLPIGAGSWYWNPSRTIPGEPITEFPFFTFLYADFHAHLIAMPIVLAAIGWGLSLVMAKWKGGLDWKKIISAAVPILFVGGMVVGALQPTNTWDYITFTVFNIIALGYVSWRELPVIKGDKLPKLLRKAILPALGVLIFIGSSRLLYYQFNHNFFPGYSSVGFWEGPRTPIWSYLLHWGLILFLIAWWFAWELYQWLATTRLSQLPEWLKKKHFLIGFTAGIGTLFLALLILKVKIALFAVPLATLALFLLVVTKNDAKRLAFFMIGTGLLLTIVVELVYLVGDVGRMNVVFKLYHQAWMLLTLPLGLAVVTLFKDMSSWRTNRQYLFQIPLFILVFIALLFPVLASQDKMSDRMSPTAPKTLDGMKYMETSVYNMNGIDMDLSQDYRAIQWLQDNVEGSPVIVEAQAYEYRWGNRFTIYTGLPGVVGWNYHQRQQRAILQDNSVQNRVDEVNAFYESQDQEFVRDFLERYGVKYIIVGQQEVAVYSYAGLDKFLAWDGLLWNEVYRDAGTAIYEVIQND
jgi:YYY domain-containing protein